MKKALKWVGIVGGATVALIVGAAVVVPMVVDVDKYRPEIVEAANHSLNGKLDIGKLSLSLWGQVRIEVDGLTLKDSAGRPVVSVKDAYFHLPLLSVLSGSPELVFVMDRPQVAVLKYKNGRMNAMGLVKPTGQPAAAQTPPQGSTSAGASNEPVKLPSIATRARLGVEMRNALVEYTDEGTGLKSEVKDLNLVIQDISLSRAMNLELWADLDTTMGKTLRVSGPARLTAHVKPALAGGVLGGAAIDAHLDLDGLDVASGESFHKAKGMAANADFAAAVDSLKKEARIDHFDLKFFNAEIKANGTITHLGDAPPASPELKLTVASNDIDLKSWNQLVPMLKDFDLAGRAKLDASAEGPSEKLGYKAHFAIQNLTAKAPKLKAEPRIDVAIDVATNELQNLSVSFKAPGNELELKGKLVNFAKPQGAFAINSPGMDLDQLIDWPPPAAKTEVKGEGSADAAGAPAGAAKAAPPADLDASVDSLRNNPAAAAAVVMVPFDFKMIKAQGIRIDGMAGKLYFKDLTAGLEGFAMKLWDGTVKASFATQLKPRQPTYTLGFLMDGLNLQKAVEANVQAVKNTLVGKLHFDLNGSGASFNADAAKANLKAKGSFKVDDAVFATVDVTKMATDGINKAIDGIAAKVPQLRGKSVGSMNGKQSRYKWISSNFSIEGGKFRMPDFATQAMPNEGIDLKGNTEVGLKDYALATTWEVIDTYDVTGARKVSAPNPAGGTIEHILAEGNNPVKFTVHAGCTCFQPCYSYTEVPEQLAKVALANVTGAASGRAKAELVKQVQKVVPQSAPPAVQNAVQNLGSKLFH